MWDYANKSVFLYKKFEYAFDIRGFLMNINEIKNVVYSKNVLFTQLELCFVYKLIIIGEMISCIKLMEEQEKLYLSKLIESFKCCLI